MFFVYLFCFYENNFVMIYIYIFEYKKGIQNRIFLFFIY